LSEKERGLKKKGKALTGRPSRGSDIPGQPDHLTIQEYVGTTLVNLWGEKNTQRKDHVRCPDIKGGGRSKDLQIGQG